MLLALLPQMAVHGQGPAKRPNIVVILADDIGYGDLGCYGATRVKTPNLDALARKGLRFTDGHSPSATCTPTRYALLTGQYAWRHKAGSAILSGVAPLGIPLDRPTLASMLRRAGYATGCIGKWHLGLGTGNPDFNAEVKPGPREVGFDYSFIVPATGDRVPCVYLENQKTVGLDPNDPIQVSYAGKIGNEPTGKENPELLKMKLSKGHDMTIVNGISRIGYMSGGKSARWVDEDMADVLTRQATGFIERNRERPFFLYFATHDIHVPRVPHPRFRGTSGCGLRGDAIHQLDWCVGEVMAALARLKLDNDTIIVFSSDNGPVLDDGYADGAVENLNGHTPAGRWRGGKYSLYEGGHRVPFLVSWPSTTKPGESDRLVCLVDLMATFAAVAGEKLADDAGPDSFSLLPLLKGETAPVRDHLVYHTNRLALRKGNWVYIPNEPVPGKKALGRTGPELYDLATDPGQERNVFARNRSVVEELATMLKKAREGTRTRH